MPPTWRLFNNISCPGYECETDVDTANAYRIYLDSRP